MKLGQTALMEVSSGHKTVWAGLEVFPTVRAFDMCCWLFMKHVYISTAGTIDINAISVCTCITSNFENSPGIYSSS